VEIPFERGLEGHSDADVLAHAICDALLGAAAMGDIGQHFPDTDPAHRNRSSLEFLREVRAKLEAAGWVIQNVDATVLAQKPKLMPHAAGMKKNLAASLGITVEALSIKATTTDGLNAEGRGEGISAQALLGKISSIGQRLKGSTIARNPVGVGLQPALETVEWRSLFFRNEYAVGERRLQDRAHCIERGQKKSAHQEV
jgi:2-C-methyl-D-erythritol 2,4-cyclodiphosphate synthase